MRAPLPTTWDEASEQALEYITNIVSTVRFEEPVWKKYNAILDSLANFVTWHEAASEAQAVSVMVDAGCMAMHSLVPITLGMDKTEMHKMLCRKQHDYGHGNISKFGLVGVAVRMCDKIARAENLTKRGGVSAQITEPLKDAYEDIIGYAVIAVMLYRNTFMLPLDSSEFAKQKYMPQQLELEI
jgi:Nucleotide modification associated domain 1